MSDDEKEPASKVKRDRSPSFPFISLGVAIQRLEAFDSYFGRHPATANKAGLAWNLKEGSSAADQTLAALRSFGLVVYGGTGPRREVTVSPEGRKYLRAQQDYIKEVVLKAAALRPRIIRKFWAQWGERRPPDPIALDTLILDNNFSDNGARAFLKVYDATVAFAKLSVTDKIPEEDSDSEDDGVDVPHETSGTPIRPKHQGSKRGVKEDIFTLHEGEVALRWPEMLSADSYQDLEDWLKLILRKIKRTVTDEAARRVQDGDGPPAV